MEFVKMGNRYLIKNSNGRIVSEKEKLQLENNELIIKDITGCNCQKETTKKLTKNKKRLKEIEDAEYVLNELVKASEETKKIKEKLEEKIKETAPETKEADVDDIIQETNTTI